MFWPYAKIPLIFHIQRTGVFHPRPLHDNRNISLNSHPSQWLIWEGVQEQALSKSWHCSPTWAHCNGIMALVSARAKRKPMRRKNTNDWCASIFFWSVQIILCSRGFTRLRLSEFVQISEFFQFYITDIVRHLSHFPKVSIWMKKGLSSSPGLFLK